MKNLILTFAIIFSFTSAYASNIGDGTLAVIKTDKVELSLNNESQKEYILSSAYNVDQDNVAMIFNSSVSMVQLFNMDGELEMMFPVGSEKVNLGMSLFEEGQYRMGFMVDGVDEVQFTDLIVR